MCRLCDTITNLPQNAAIESPSRRRLFKMAGAASVAAPLAAAGVSTAWAQSLPKPANDLTPDAALERLMAGNARYVSGNTQPVDFAKTRASLAGGQNPYASLVSCADSRIGPEYAFDEGRGDLFVTRVAGNFVNTDILASLEYGAAVLGSSLIMVLGHTSCGAIGATVKAVKENASFPGHINALTTALAPAVRALPANTKPEDLVLAATIENVKQNVQMLQQATPILSELVVQAKLKVVGGLYHLDTGKVELVA